MIVGLSGSTYCRVIGSNAFVRMGRTPFAFDEPIRQALLTLDPHLGIGGSQSEHIYQTLRPLVTDRGWDHALRHPAYRGEVRQLIAKMGRALRDLHGQDVLLRHMEHAIEDRFADYDTDGTGNHVVITDIQRPDEVAWIKDRGGIVLHVIDTDDMSAHGQLEELANQVIRHDGDDTAFVESLVHLAYPTPSSDRASLV